MRTYKNLYTLLCSYENLFLAYKKARKHKTTKDYVVEFEKDLEDNLLLLRSELLLHSYRPKPLVNFIIRDPKTRKISKSDFRDRIVHHALCNLIEPIFERRFIYDSYANRKGKGALKADIKKYFENVDHEVLTNAIHKRIKDKRIIWLIKKILANPHHGTKGKGMPLGNLTSQFFANVYLNELDKFVKHTLKVKHYISYDELYDSLEGWIAYAKNANTYRLRKNIVSDFEKEFSNQILTKEINRLAKEYRKITYFPCKKTV